DDAKFPNKANLVDNVKDVSFDPGRKFSVPWLSGMTGIGYNPKKTGRELTSMNDIFDPKYKGQVTMLTEGVAHLGQHGDLTLGLGVEDVVHARELAARLLGIVADAGHAGEPWHRVLATWIEADVP